MGISNQDFRVRIGMFQNTNMKSRNKFKCEPTKLKVKSCLSTVAIYLSILLIVNCLLLNPSDGVKTRNTNFKSNLKKCLIKTEDLMTNQTFCWSQYGLSINKIQKIINGNRRVVEYKLAVWNCSRGLVQDGFSNKLVEIKQFIELKKPHCFAVIEADIYGLQCQKRRHRKYSTAEIKEKLKLMDIILNFPQPGIPTAKLDLFAMCLMKLNTKENLSTMVLIISQVSL